MPSIVLNPAGLSKLVLMLSQLLTLVIPIASDLESVDRAAAMGLNKSLHSSGCAGCEYSIPVVSSNKAISSVFITLNSRFQSQYANEKKLLLKWPL